MDPKFGLTALQRFLNMMRTELINECSETGHEPFMILLTDAFPGFPTESGADDYEDFFQPFEATFPGYARITLTSDDVSNAAIIDPDTDDHARHDIVEQEWAFSGSPGDAEDNTMGSVALFKWDGVTTHKCLAWMPITPKIMNADGDTLTIQMTLNQWSKPFPPA